MIVAYVIAGIIGFVLLALAFYNEVLQVKNRFKFDMPFKYRFAWLDDRPSPIFFVFQKKMCFTCRLTKGIRTDGRWGNNEVVLLGIGKPNSQGLSLKDGDDILEIKNRVDKLHNIFEEHSVKWEVGSEVQGALEKAAEQIDNFAVVRTADQENEDADK